MVTRRTPAWLALGLSWLVLPGAGVASGIPAVDGLEEVVVHARRLALIGDVAAASEGTVLAAQLENRPILRPAEVLEAVPGLVVTQHSGDGKANQYFLRGFNLDHGTDFATRVDGMPVNMPTHAHGQGYTDLNFLIPELVDHIEYRKGTYYPEEGDFSAAGAADVRYRRRLDAPFATVSAGQDGFERLLAAASPRIAGGDLLVAAEYFHNDGPWDLPEGYRKLGALLKYSRGDAAAGYALEAQGYDGRWRSSDQIPQRAVSEGIIDRYGTIDPTDGGRTHRYALAAEGWGAVAGGRLRANAYAIDYQLDLLSDFTYFIDPVHGDQFEQYDARRVVGAAVGYTRPSTLLDRPGELSAGVQVRVDDISPVGLYRTVRGVRYATVSEDRVREGSIALYAADSVRWTPWLRTDLGGRIDRYDFAVRSNLAANSGTVSAAIASPKFTVALGPWSSTEFFLNVGRGFHSNDARGTTLRVDPNDGTTPVAPVSPLVRAVGAEAGLRSAPARDLQLALAWWTLRLDSELLFSGDGGTTEPSRASRRTGVELGVFYSPLAWLVVDADLSWTHARFTDVSPLGDHIPNALQSVVSLGVTANRDTGWFGGLRLRYFGPAPLIEDDSIRSGSTLLLNVSAGYHVNARVSVTATVYNALDRHDDDIAYYYASQLRGEAAPVEDLHFHPVEPRTVRLALLVRF